MSLLLDALKRAEQEKQSRQAERPVEAAKGRAAPGAPAAPAPPSASLELQPQAAAAAAANRSAAPAGRIDAEPANTAFHAKGAPSQDSRKGGVLWAIAGAIVVVILAAGAYVWYSMEALRPQAVARPRPPFAPLPPPASGQPVAALKLEELAPRRAPPSPATPPEPRKAPKADPTEEMVMNLLKENRSSPPAAAPLMLGRTQETARVPAEVAAGYVSLRNGDLAAARRSYAAALASQAQSLDAELGLATVEARSGNGNAALAHYRKALELDPRNATALAGLASLADYSQPYALEAQIRSDLASHPQSAALHFTLGNLYASHRRWGEAQAEFFEAHRLEPASADILLNLAVSLDHLGRPRLAAEFYARALEAAKGQATQFDPAPVERRLAEIGR